MRATLLGGLAAALLALPACGYLRDTEPFTQTIRLEDREGRVVPVPLEFSADNSFGDIQVVNDTQKRQGFAIKELGVFIEIPAKQNRTARVQEARDGRIYEFYDHLDEPQSEWRGRMTVHYVAEEDR